MVYYCAVLSVVVIYDLVDFSCHFGYSTSFSMFYHYKYGLLLPYDIARYFPKCSLQNIQLCCIYYRAYTEDTRQQEG